MMRTKEYVAIYESGGRNWSAFAPDVPGCAAVGDTLEECARNFKEALAFHLRGLQEDGLPIPEPTTEAGRVQVVIAA